MRFSDKVVAITGAAQGIGRQTAEQAAAEGAALLLIDRSSYVHELAATLAQSGCPVLALEADCGGPVAYWLGQRLGAITFLQPTIVVGALTTGWLVLMLLFHILLGRRQ